MYWTAMTVCRPVMRWGRMQVEGLETLPESGPVLVVGNHDSHWDPMWSASRRSAGGRSKRWPNPSSGKCAVWVLS